MCYCIFSEIALSLLLLVRSQKEALLNRNYLQDNKIWPRKVDKSRREENKGLKSDKFINPLRLGDDKKGNKGRGRTINRPINSLVHKEIISGMIIILITVTVYSCVLLQLLFVLFSVSFACQF